MERKLKSFWVLSLSLMTLSEAAMAGNGNGNIWDDIIKRLSNRNGKVIKLTAGREAKPALKFSPKVLGFKGVLQVPSTITLSNGSGVVNPIAGQIVFDNQIVCNYSPKNNSFIWNKVYYLQNCSDGSRAREEVNVNSKVELKLNYASSDKASLVANVTVVRSDEVEYGLVFPYLNPSEGQILMYNGEAWVAADPSELDLQGLQGEQGAQGPQGEMGPQGPQGPAGATGAQGPAGVAGAKGDKGDKGDAGVAGPAGAAGAIGPQGPAGAAGVAGPVGPMGPQGPKGDIGPAGAAGAAGAVGAMGPQGPAGATGAQGPAGVAGPVGPQGPKGDTGATGAAGAAGAVGPMGPQGPAGADGAPGLAGAQGPQGPAGAVGATGAQGPQGPKGDRGSDGAQGPQGPMGMMGMTGAQGPAGAQGLPGPQGAAGPAGAAGAKGDKGDKGDRGLSEIAYMRDERASGVSGGTCTSGAWNTRSLNTLGGDTNFISLSANRFVLQPGTYFIEIVAPGHGVNQHQAKLKVIETNTDVMFGTNIASVSTAASTTLSTIMGEIVVTAASSFEVQHRCATTKADIGFGAPASFGSPEIYTQVKIIKKQ